MWGIITNAIAKNPQVSKYSVNIFAIKWLVLFYLSTVSISSESSGEWVNADRVGSLLIRIWSFQNVTFPKSVRRWQLLSSTCNKLRYISSGFHEAIDLPKDGPKSNIVEAMSKNHHNWKILKFFVKTLWLFMIWNTLLISIQNHSSKMFDDKSHNMFEIVFDGSSRAFPGPP